MGNVDYHDGFAIPRRIVLAHEPPFDLGFVAVVPPLRELRNGARRETIEPRVMQVFVALARADGELVTRDELVESCWNGRIVGDDAVNRAISRIRRLCEGIGEGCFSVETVPRIGYRLVRHTQPENWLDTLSAQASTVAVDRRALIIGAAAVSLVGAGAASFRAWSAISGGPSREARALYDRATSVRQNGRLKENREAIALLREAVRLSAHYGEAWAALALAYRTALEEEPPERVAGFRDRFHEALRNARRYDGVNGDMAVAEVPFWTPFGRWLEAEAAYFSITRRFPRYARGLFGFGSLLTDVGRWSEALTPLRAARRLQEDWVYPRYKLAVAMWSAGHLSQAEEEIDEALRLWPEQGAIWQTKIKMLALTGRAYEALALAENPSAVPLDPVHAPDPEGRRLYLIALATRHTVDIDRSLQLDLHTARTLEAERTNVALRAVSLGNVQLGLDILEGVYLGTAKWRLETMDRKWLSAHPLFQPHARPLWSEPRFNRIVDAIGLERYWHTTGRIPDYRRSA